MNDFFGGAFYEYACWEYCYGFDCLCFGHVEFESEIMLGLKCRLDVILIHRYDGTILVKMKFEHRSQNILLPSLL